MILARYDMDGSGSIDEDEIYRLLEVSPVTNDEFCIEKDEFCIKKDELCTKKDGFCIKMMMFCRGAMDPPGG